MDCIEELKAKIKKQSEFSYEDFPDIQLYMDQVLEYLSREELTFKEGDKLTSAMINNYIKDGLLPRASGKKYSREHLVYLSVIARLKQVLSVKDSGILIGKEINKGEEKCYYENFLSQLASSFAEVEKSLDIHKNECISSLAMHLAINSYVNKIACEYLISKMEEEDNPPTHTEEKEKKKKKANKKN